MKRCRVAMHPHYSTDVINFFSIFWTFSSRMPPTKATVWKRKKDDIVLKILIIERNFFLRKLNREKTRKKKKKQIRRTGRGKEWKKWHRRNGKKKCSERESTEPEIYLDVCLIKQLVSSLIYVVLAWASTKEAKKNVQTWFRPYN